MSQLTKSNYGTTYENSAGTFADNVSREVSEGDMRQFAADTKDSVLFIDDAHDTIQFIIDGGGSAISTGVKGDIMIPFGCTAVGWDIVSDVPGSIVVDVWKDTYASFPPTVADTITASAKPTLSTAQKNQNTTLTGWTTAFTRGDWLRYNVDSATTVTRVTVVIRVKRTS